MKPVYIWTALWNIDTKIDNRGRVRAENQLRGYSPADRYNLLARVVEEAWVAMAKDLMAFLQEVMESDGQIDEREQQVLDTVGLVFDQTGRSWAGKVATEVKRTTLGRLRTKSEASC